MPRLTVDLIDTFDSIAVPSYRNCSITRQGFLSYGISRLWAGISRPFLRAAHGRAWYELFLSHTVWLCLPSSFAFLDE